MENEELKRILKQLPIPEHGHESKDKALESALAEFRHHTQNKKKFKGFSLLSRLMDKKHTGGFLMSRQIAIGTGVAVGVIAFASVFSVYMVSNMKPPFVHEKTTVATVKNNQPVSSLPSETGTLVVSGQETVRNTEQKTVSVNNPIKSTTAKTKPLTVAEKEVATTAATEAPKEIIAKQAAIQVNGKATDANMMGKGASTPLGSSATMAQETGGSNEFTLEEITVSKMERAQAAAKYVAPKVAREVVKPNEELPTIGQASALVDNRVIALPAPPVIDKKTLLNQEYVGRDKFEKITPNPVKLVAEEPVSTFSIDVDTASYAFVRRALDSGYLPQKDSIRIEELINYFDYKYPLPKDRNMPFKPTVAVFATPWNPNTKLLHIGIKGFDIVPEKKPKANLVFLIDVSGSMESDDKLPLLKNSLRMFVDTLKPDDTVAIVTYAGSTAVALERTKGADKAKILAAIDQLHAGGSTSGAEGIRTAYSLAETGFDPKDVNRIILATDGDFNVGITDSETLKNFVERKRKNGIYLSVLGFGQGNYNDELMQKLAQNGNGNAAYIDNLNEARKVLVDEASSTLFTIAKDVKIQVEFNPAMVSEYRLIGYETRLLNREDFKNDNVDAGDIGSGHSVTAIYEITPQGSIGQLIDDLRYDSKKTPESVKSAGNSSEYAFFKIRYKLPDETLSREINTAIDKSNEYKNISDAPVDSRFATAVAAFGQLLKGDSHINQFTYDDVINLGRSSMGDDLYGYRAEFLNLTRLAKTASAVGDR
jgi:Ca-activated chloride channel homolog